MAQITPREEKSGEGREIFVRASEGIFKRQVSPTDREKGLIMNAKEYLGQVALLDAQINGAVADMQRWYDRATSITAQPKTIVTYDEKTGKITKNIAPPSFGSGISDKVGESVAEYVDVELEADIKGLLQRRQEIIDTLRKVKHKDRFSVLCKSFVLNMTNQEIADSMDRSLTWVSTTKSEAIREVEEILGLQKK